MPLLFSYGTLRDEQVQLSVFGRLLVGHKDDLLGYEQVQARVADPEFVRVSGKSQHSSLRPARSVLDELRINFPIVLECDLALDGVIARFDRQRMTGALLNVLTNACEAMEDSDRGRRGELCVLTVGARSEGDRLVLIVEDTGPGVPEALHNELTSPLFSSMSYGVGLGLFIVQDVIERHAGGLTPDSTVGEGTRVTMWPPAPRGLGPSAP